jgi:hypothetical protein
MVRSLSTVQGEDQSISHSTDYNLTPRAIDWQIFDRSPGVKFLPGKSRGDALALPPLFFVNGQSLAS